MKIQITKKNVTKHLKKHWFKYSVCLLLIYLTIICSAVTNAEIEYANSLDVKKIDLLTLTANEKSIPKEIFEIEINSMYNFYEKLGYDFSLVSMGQTRRQNLELIQNKIEKNKTLEKFLTINNVEIETKKIFEDNYKKLTTKEDIYTYYLNYSQGLEEETSTYIINSGKINIEQEIEKIKTEYNITDINKISELLIPTLKEKMLDIIISEVKTFEENQK